MKQPLILIGGGGHAKSCIDVIEEEDKYSIYGILDMPKNIGRKLLGYEIIGTEDLLGELIKQKYSFLITVGQISSPTIRMKIFNSLKGNGANIATILSPRASVSKYAKIGEGSIVMHGARINAASTVGVNNIINTNAVIEHDTVTGNHCHISTQAVLNGNCVLGDGVFLGSATTVLQGIEITSNSVIGAATLVNKSIHNAGTYVGIPFERIK